MQTPLPAAAPAATPASDQLCGILRDLCKVKRDIDRFYKGAPESSVIKEMPKNYLDAEDHLCSALGCLFDYVGNYLWDEYMRALDHE